MSGSPSNDARAGRREAGTPLAAFGERSERGRPGGSPDATPAWRDQVTAVVLAGGRARRMGGEDKGLVELAGHPLVEYVLTAVAPQAATVLVSANRHRERYASFGYPVVADRIAGYPGPLAGIASALEVVTTPYLLTVPCDAPLVPPDLTERLYRALVEASAELSVAHDGERSQPVFALVRRTLLPRLLAYLESGGRGVGAWHARLRVAHADFSGQPRAFLNVNTPEERAALERRLGEKTGA